jgi:hypothetical protein
MFGLVVVRYRREPIMLCYSFGPTNSPSSSVSSAVVILISVDKDLESYFLNFLMMSFVYLA